MAGKTSVPGMLRWAAGSGRGFALRSDRLINGVTAWGYADRRDAELLELGARVRGDAIRADAGKETAARIARADRELRRKLEATPDPKLRRELLEAFDARPATIGAARLAGLERVAP